MSVFAKIKNNKVIKNFSFLTISNFLNQFILVFSGIKIARTLGPANFGMYSYVFVQIYLYTAIGELGIRSILIRTIARNFKSSRPAFLSAIFLQFLGLIFSSALVLIYEHYAKSIEPSVVIYVIFITYLLNLWSSSEAVWQGHQKMGIPAFINVFYSLVWMVFVLCIPEKSFSVHYLFKTFAIIQLLQTSSLLICMFCVKGILTGKISGFFKNSLRILKDSSYFYLNVMITLPTNYLSNNFLERNSSKAQLGYFNMSNRLINPIKTVINLALSAAFPHISVLWVTDNKTLIKKLEKSIPIVIIMFGLASFSFAMLSKEIILFLFGSKFLPSVHIIQFQIWFIFVFAINCLFGTIWAATDHQKKLLTWAIINSVVACPFLWFGSKHGGLGLSYAYLIPYSLVLPFLCYSFVKTYKLKINFFWPLIIILVLFAISSFLPLTTSVWIRFSLVFVSVMILGKVYYNKLLAAFKLKIDSND